MSEGQLVPHTTPLVREIYRRMKELGLNPNQLAVKIGRNESYFRDLFRGKARMPAIDHLPAIAEALNCEISDLLHPGSASFKPATDRNVNEADEIALLGLWRLLSPEGKARVMRAVIKEAQRAARGVPEDDTD